MSDAAGGLLHSRPELPQTHPPSCAALHGARPESVIHLPLSKCLKLGKRAVRSDLHLGERTGLPDGLLGRQGGAYANGDRPHRDRALMLQSLAVRQAFNRSEMDTLSPGDFDLVGHRQ